MSEKTEENAGNRPVQTATYRTFLLQWPSPSKNRRRRCSQSQVPPLTRTKPMHVQTAKDPTSMQSHRSYLSPSFKASTSTTRPNRVHLRPRILHGWSALTIRIVPPPPPPSLLAPPPPALEKSPSVIGSHRQSSRALTNSTSWFSHRGLPRRTSGVMVMRM